MISPEPSSLIRLVRRIAVPENGAGDGELLRRFVRAGDAEAFAAIVQRHGPMVYGVCTRMLDDAHEAEDCFQATFLILARRARAVGRPELVGGWLHGVAQRVATRARALLARRRARERQVVDVPARQAEPALIWTDLRPVLDAEVARLPERLRLPFVLCYLDGHTNEEAAARLGCPKGTVLSRLATARERLRRRLTRRGITLSAMALTACLAEEASAAVPAALVETTIRSIAQASSAHVTVLVEGVLTIMRMQRLAKMFGVLLVCALIVGGTGVLFGNPLPAKADAQEHGKTQLPAVARDADTTDPSPEAPEPGQQDPPAGAADQGKQVPPGAPKDEEIPPVQPQQVREAFLINDALADELFTGHRIRVVGTMERIKRVQFGPTNPKYYRLTMQVPLQAMSGPGGGTPPGMGPPGSGKGSAPSQPLDTFIFDFPLAAGKELASLRPGNRVTIEGLCDGPGDDHFGRQVIRFREAKLIKVDREGAK
jgi:RNA polymerase sigma factor (sigma-70 family)